MGAFTEVSSMAKSRSEGIKSGNKQWIVFSGAFENLFMMC